MPAITRLMLDGQPAPVSHYCHVVRAGNLIWVSGTVGMAADGSIPDDVAAQFDLALSNLDACLKAAGAGPEHVVKVTVFLTDVNVRATGADGKVTMNVRKAGEAIWNAPTKHKEENLSDKPFEVVAVEIKD